MLQTTDKLIGDKTQSTPAEKQDVPGNISGANDVSSANRINGSNENLSNTKKLKNQARLKKPTLTKANSFETDFLTSEVKEAFIHLQKAFTKPLILRYFDLERHIRIKTDALGYVIGTVLSWINLNQPFSNFVTHKNHSDFSKSEIGQWYSVAFFLER